MTSKSVLLAVLFVAAEASAGGEQVDLRSYWCEGSKQHGAGAHFMPYGNETRIGIFDHANAGAKVILLECSVDAPPALKVKCRALRGEDNVSEPVAPVALAFGKPTSIDLIGEGRQSLTATFIAYESGSGPDFGPYRCPFALPTAAETSAVTPSVTKKLEISGVDEQAGDPELWVMSNGSLNLHFQAFPPTHVTTEAQTEPYATYAQQLEQFLGVPVSWEDRELFFIAHPKRDTIEKVEAFVKAFPNVPES